MNFKKLLGITFIIIAIINMIFLALGRISNKYFWIIIIVCGIFTYLVFPKIK